MRRSERIVYAVRNKVNNKSYIGFCIDFKERKSRHLQCTKNGVPGKFYDAMRKHGHANFEWMILFDNLGDIEDCKLMEKRMIGLFDTFNNGYNGTEGGTGGNTFNGNNNSGLFQKGSVPWNKGEKWSKEHRVKLSEAHKGVPLSREHNRNKSMALRKPVKQLTKDGELIRVWESIKGAGEFLNIHPVSISGVVRGKNTSAGGYKWEFYNNKR